MNVRPLEDADVERALAVRNTVFRREPLELAYYRARLDTPSRRDFVAEIDGAIVGVAHSMPNIWEPTSGYAFSGLAVLAEHRRRGVGTTLLRAISAHAELLGSSGLAMVAAEDEPDALSFLEKRGFEVVGRMQHVTLDLADAPDDQPSVPGVEIRPASEATEQQLYAVALEAEADVPAPSGVGSIDVPTFEDWQRRSAGSPLAGRAHSFVAIVDGEIVGYALMGGGSAGVGFHEMTAVKPAWRGRGIALALKQAQIAGAKAAGLRQLAAANSEHNPAMRRVNERLGYRPQPAALHFRGPLQTR